MIRLELTSLADDLNLVVPARWVEPRMPTRARPDPAEFDETSPAPAKRRWANRRAYMREYMRRRRAAARRAIA